MSNYRFQNNNNNYPSAPYNNNNNRGGGNYQGRTYTQTAPSPKRSGAIYTRMKKGKYEGALAVNAWRKTKAGLMKATAFPVDGVVHTGKEKGHDFMRYVVNITNSSTGTHETFWCLMRMDTKMIVIKELSLVISPNGSGFTASGKKATGYFGANYKKR